jgi:uncharacterized protein DUF3631
MTEQTRQPFKQTEDLSIGRRKDILIADQQFLEHASPGTADAAPRSEASDDPPGHGPTLLRDVEAFVSRFVVHPGPARLPVALWAMGTHLFECFETFPYLALLSPEKGCGKTRTTEVLEQIVSEPVRAVCISEAAVFRLIEDRRPTLILDEAEVLTGKGERAEAVRALLNAGNRSGAMVPRCVGNSHELRMFDVYCPKIVCAIRVCPETIRDRSLVVSMQRKKPTDVVERYIRRRIRPAGDELRARLEEWAGVIDNAVVAAYERLDVDFLSDRELENFEPLLAILTVTDPSRLPELRSAAESLASGKAEDAKDDSLSLRLLADIRDVWPTGRKRIFTRNLLGFLKTVPDAPWAEDFSLNERKLARFLAPYGVHPGDVREDTGAGDENGKGYKIEDFKDVFSSYLPPIRDKGDNAHEC